MVDAAVKRKDKKEKNNTTKKTALSKGISEVAGKLSKKERKAQEAADSVKPPANKKQKLAAPEPAAKVTSIADAQPVTSKAELKKSKKKKNKVEKAVDGLSAKPDQAQRLKKKTTKAKSTEAQEPRTQPATEPEQPTNKKQAKSKSQLDDVQTAGISKEQPEAGWSADFVGARQPAKKQKKAKALKAADDRGPAAVPAEPGQLVVQSYVGEKVDQAETAEADNKPDGIPQELKKNKKNKNKGDKKVKAADAMAATAAVSEPTVLEDASKAPAAAAAGPADENGSGGAAAAENGMLSSNGGKRGVKQKGNGNGEENGGSAGRAFQRVKAEEWLGKKGSWNNSYEANFGEAGWGAKAQSILGQVRGKDFRHEKTKKKRGTYRGGEIEPDAVRSFKFESDDES